MLSVVHQRWSKSYIRIVNFSPTSFSQFASSKFVISVRNFEAYASYHFIHQRCCLLVNKDGHTFIFASHVFSLTSFWQFNFRNFANSVLRSFSEYNAYYHFIHQQCCLLVIKDSNNLVFASQVFLLISFLQIAASIFLGSVLRSFSEFNAYYHFIHQQCCLLVTKDCHNLIFASQVFSLTSFWQFASCNFVNSVFWKLWGVYCFLPLSSSTVLSVGYQRESLSYFHVASFFAEIFLAICFLQLRECCFTKLCAV